MFAGATPIYRNLVGTDDLLVQTRVADARDPRRKGDREAASRPGPPNGGFTVSQVLQQHLEPLGVPAFEGSFFGHISDQFSLPEGAEAEIDADAGTIRILEPAVA